MDLYLELKTETTERAALKNKNDELQENFDTKQAEWSEAKSQLLKKLQDSHGLSQKHNFKVADSVIIGDWHTLKHLIGQFVNKYTCQVANVMEREPTFSLTSCIAPETLQYLATSEFYPLMFEAYIWRWIKELVFRSNSTLWAGDLGVKFSAISVTVGSTFLSVLRLCFISHCLIPGSMPIFILYFSFCLELLVLTGIHWQIYWLMMTRNTFYRTTMLGGLIQIDF